MCINTPTLKNRAIASQFSRSEATCANLPAARTMQSGALPSHPAHHRRLSRLLSFQLRCRVSFIAHRAPSAARSRSTRSCTHKGKRDFFPALM